MLLGLRYVLLCGEHLLLGEDVLASGKLYVQVSFRKVVLVRSCNLAIEKIVVNRFHDDIVKILLIFAHRF